MPDVLFLLVKLNLAMGAAIVLVALLRRPLRAQFGAPIAYAIWLLVPIAGMASLLPPRVAPPGAIAAAPVPAESVSVISHIARSTLDITGQLTAQSALALTAPPSAMPDAALLLFAAWVLGAVLMTLHLARLQLRFSAAARAGKAGPAVLGFLRPRIVTPKGFHDHFTAQEQAAILAHERVHLARQDARINALTTLLRCLCWFNPLIHLGSRWLRIDQELACDATAVAGSISRRDYAKALLKSQLVVAALPLGCYWPGSQHPLIERIALLKRKPPGTARRLAGAGLVLLAASFAGLSAWAAQPSVAAEPAAVPPPITVSAMTPAPTAGKPVADAGQTGSASDASEIMRANKTAIAVPAPEKPRTVRIETPAQPVLAALPQLALVSEPKIIADPSSTSEDTSPAPQQVLAKNDVAAPTTGERAAAAASSPRRPRTEAALECLLGIGPAACWKNAYCEDGVVERVNFLGANATGDDIYEVQYMHTDSVYGIAPPASGGRILWFKKRGNPNAIIPSSLVAIPSRSVPVSIYTRRQDSPGGCGDAHVPGFPYY